MIKYMAIRMNGDTSYISFQLSSSTQAGSSNTTLFAATERFFSLLNSLFSAAQQTSILEDYVESYVNY